MFKKTDAHTKTQTVDIRNDISMLLECEECEGSFLDTRVTIAGKSLCWISWPEKDKFIADLKEVIEKHAI